MGLLDMRRCNLEECLNHIEQGSRNNSGKMRIISPIAQPADIRMFGLDLLLREELCDDEDFGLTPADNEQPHISLDDLLDFSSASARFAAAKQPEAVECLPTFLM